MDARLDDLSTTTIAPPRRVRPPRLRVAPFGKTLAHALTAERVATWEWGVAITALFLLGRTPVLFIRRQLAGLFNGRTTALWQDDLVILGVFVGVQLIVLVLAVKHANADALLRQKPLLAFLALAWASTAWSVEPSVSFRRSLLFMGTAVVGWYLGDRFSLGDQRRIVVGVAALGTAASFVVLVVWPDLATQTSGHPGEWSGVYVNRNMLGLAMSMGLLALAFVAAEGARRWWLAAAGASFLFWAVLSHSRTGPVGLVVALVVTAFVYWVRRVGHGKLTAAGGAAVVVVTTGIGALAADWHRDTLITWLGREPTMAGRTTIWHLTRWFSDLNPWHGWGFEAIWANPKVIGQAQAAKGALHRLGPGVPGAWPHSAHNGYYEILLSVGRIGLAVFAVFLAVAAWRAFRYAWSRSDLASLWPLSFIVFAVVVNLTESFFISSEALWALTVAVAVGVTEAARRDAP